MPLVGDLNIQQQPIQLRALPLNDFTGGLCLVRDGFLVPDNSSPDMCNVDVLPEGGICTRDGLSFAHNNELPAKICNIWQRQHYNQEATVMVSLENGEVWEINCDARIATPTGIPPASNPAECCWRGVQANDVMYIYNGVDAPFAMDATGAIRPLAQAWNDWVEGQDPPVAGYEMPMCGAMVIAKKMAFFQGKLWAAGITYPPATRPLSDFTKGQPVTAVDDAEGTKNPEGMNVETLERCNRIHFSFPIQGETGPEDWDSNDWFDLDEGADGECITAMVPCGNTMYVFKEHSVYAVTLNEEGFPINQKVLDKVGTPSCDSVVCCEGNLFFWDTRQGLHVIQSDGSYLSLFTKLLPLLTEDCPDPSVFADARVGFCDGRIYVSMPWRDEVYVMDNKIGTRPWMKYDWQVCNFFYFCPSGEAGWCVAASSCSNYLVKFGGIITQPFLKQDVVRENFDYYSPTKAELIRSYYCTNWFGASSSAASNPFTKKDWCGVDLIGYGPAVELEYRANQDERCITGTTNITWDIKRFGPCVVLGEYCFPDIPMCKSDDEIFPDPFYEFPDDAPCLIEFDEDADVKGKGTCIDLPCESCSLQICFRGIKRWCICSMQIQFREGPNPKEEYQRT